MEVRLPNRPEPLWLCVSDREDHAVPLVVLTNQRADTRAAPADEAGPPARPAGHPCLTRAAPVVAASLPGQTRSIRPGAPVPGSQIPGTRLLAPGPRSGGFPVTGLGAEGSAARPG